MFPRGIHQPFTTIKKKNKEIATQNPPQRMVLRCFSLSDAMKRIVYLICLTLVVGACKTKESPLPDAPKYSLSTQWYISERGADADVFYIISTECSDYVRDGDTIHYADTYNDSIREMMLGEMRGVDKLLAGELNYYTPFYRQCTMETYAADSLTEARMPLAYNDVRKAFKYYLEHYNNGRPIILAGFSQGAMAVVDLLKEMDEETYRRLIAAYVIGYKVTADDIAKTAHIEAAKDSDDLGVTICYNSVRDNSCAMPLLSDGNKIAINPVNWRRDNTPATIVDTRHGDTLTIALDTTTLLLQIDNYKHEDYMIPLIGKDGNYHRLDLTLYSELLRKNMALRAKKYVERSKSEEEKQ